MKIDDETVNKIQEASDRFKEALEQMGFNTILVGWTVQDDAGMTFSGDSHSEDMNFTDQAERLFLISGHIYSNMSNDNPISK